MPTLVVGEHPEDVDLRVGGEPEALGAAGDDARHECPVAEPVVKRLLVRPVRALAHTLEVRMRLGQPFKKQKSFIHSFMVILGMKLL